MNGPIVPPLSGVSFGSSGVKILAGPGDPGLATTDDRNGSVASSAVGSLFLRTDAPDSTHGLYVKTAFATGSAGTWTSK